MGTCLASFLRMPSRRYCSLSNGMLGYPSSASREEVTWEAKLSGSKWLCRLCIASAEAPAERDSLLLPSAVNALETCKWNLVAELIIRDKLGKHEIRIMKG